MSRTQETQFAIDTEILNILYYQRQITLIDDSSAWADAKK